MYRSVNNTKQNSNQKHGKIGKQLLEYEFKLVAHQAPRIHQKYEVSMDMVPFLMAPARAFISPVLNPGTK